MMVRAARYYVLLLFIIDLMLLATSLVLNVATWAGESELYDVAMPLLAGALFTNFVVLFLAKERNVWKNEFRACPWWLKVMAISLAGYGFGVAIVQTIGRSEGPDNPMTISAVPLGFEALSITVLYSVLWRGSLNTTELRNRAGISFAVVAAVFTVLLVNRFR